MSKDSTRFSSVLTLALHPNTGENEATAAFYAARRIVAARGIESLDT